ncbi:MAG: HlyD family efflux transporter periplasmic adaptor subunit [Bacteroidales bacterium]|jgi:multidrug efflux pump subunit AcrA (membrane-fusion protein)|nr:HlyD family efflux transporter periplasmic adaptor subunit [Bacteroidales bacterium]
MKRTIIITFAVIIVALAGLFAFNKIASQKENDSLFAEAVKGNFEISISASGEIVPENSIDIKAPEVSRGRDFRASDLKITDMVAEGTMVKEGDYIATLDRTQYNNMLKDELERLSTYRNNLEMKKLDTAVTLNNLRDAIRNQRHTVEEAEITLRNSKYEPPSTIRQAEINVDKQKRLLEQKQRGYELRVAQAKRDIRNQTIWANRIERRVESLQEVLSGFTVTAPASGMVVYKRDRRGNKIKTGSSVNAFDRTVATLPDLSTLLSKIYVSEIDIRRIKPGLDVEIRVDAFPDKAFRGKIHTVANIGEKLENSDSKVFEVMVKINGTDAALRPAMTTSNKVIISTYNDVIYIPTECVHAGLDKIPYVYTKNKTKQIVVTGEANDKNIIIEKGLKPKQLVYTIQPENAEEFRTEGEELIGSVMASAGARQ